MLIGYGHRSETNVPYQVVRRDYGSNGSNSNCAISVCTDMAQPMLLNFIEFVNHFC